MVYVDMEVSLFHITGRTSKRCGKWHDAPHRNVGTTKEDAFKVRCVPGYSTAARLITHQLVSNPRNKIEYLSSCTEDHDKSAGVLYETAKDKLTNCKYICLYLGQEVGKGSMK